MSDTEIVKLKKEVQTLREYNAQLKQQLEEQGLLLGELEMKNLNLTNENLMIKEEDTLLRDPLKIQKLIASALSEEKAETEKYKIKSNKLSDQLQIYTQRLKDSEIYIQKLQQENSKLKKDLLEFGQKHEAKDYIEDSKGRRRKGLHSEGLERFVRQNGGSFTRK